MKKQKEGSGRLEHRRVTWLAIVGCAGLAGVGVAGTGPDAAVGLPVADKRDGWLKPTLNLRARYEYADVADPALGNAVALTVRERVGLLAGPFAGFSAFAEFEGTQVLDSHYATPFPTQPGPAPVAAIADPGNAELNRAWIEWSGFDTSVKFGRQRILFDNEAMISNGGWRQNEQTFDAVSISTEALDGFEFQYVFADRVQRIFGADAIGAFRRFEGATHLLHAVWEGPEDLAVTGYIYLMDFNEVGQASSNNTYGMIVERPFALSADWALKLRAEAAWQTDASSTPIDYQAGYGHLLASASRDIHTVSLGYEHLGADNGRLKATGGPAGISFRTPLATAHGFNGYADALAAARTAGTPGGIGDLYASYAVALPDDWKVLLALHWLGDDDFGFGTGWEADAVLSRRLCEHVTAIGKLGWFESAGGAGNPAPYDTLRFSVQMDVTF